MSNPYHDDLSQFAVSFLLSVIAWNNAEDSARQILGSLAQGGIGAQAAITHLGNVSLVDAIKTVTETMAETASDEEKLKAEHIDHFVDGFELLRAYRNFYVHSLRGAGKSPYEPDVFHGWLNSTEARRRLAHINGYVTLSDLRKFTVQTVDLQNYGSDIASAIRTTNALTGLLAKSKSLSSLQKPTWPEKLRKPRRYLVERENQPQS